MYRLPVCALTQLSLLQPFYDENEAKKAQAKQERDEFFRTTSVSDLKKLNAIRKAQGKTKYRSTQKPPMPVTPFISSVHIFHERYEEGSSYI